MQILQPPAWARPKGYSNGVSTSGTLIFISGQIGWDGQGKFHTRDFVKQSKQALENIVAILAEAGGKPEHITRLTWYVVDKLEYLDNGKALGKAYREVMGKYYPAMTAIQVTALMEDAARVEIEATAVIPLSMTAHEKIKGA